MHVPSLCLSVGWLVCLSVSQSVSQSLSLSIVISECLLVVHDPLSLSIWIFFLTVFLYPSFTHIGSSNPADERQHAIVFHSQKVFQKDMDKSQRVALAPVSISQALVEDVARKISSFTVSLPSLSLTHTHTHAHLILYSLKGLDLFGFDLIIDRHTKQVYVIDVNAFPGYGDVENVNEKLEQFILHKWSQHKSRSNQ